MRLRLEADELLFRLHLLYAPREGAFSRPIHDCTELDTRIRNALLDFGYRDVADLFIVDPFGNANLHGIGIKGERVLRGWLHEQKKQQKPADAKVYAIRSASG
jgi:hypothetical protein